MKFGWLRVRILGGILILAGPGYNSPPPMSVCNLDISCLIGLNENKWKTKQTLFCSTLKILKPIETKSYGNMWGKNGIAIVYLQG